MITVQSVNLFLSQLVLLSGALLVLGLFTGAYAILSGKLKKFLAYPLFRFISSRALMLSFIVALAATLGSLFYSEIAGYTPCKLCWYQRILMYPQAVMLGIAAARKDNGIVLYGLVLSGIGAAIAAYHYLLQIGLVDEIAPCTTVGYSVSCTETFTMTYGFITIPFMSLVAFLLIIALLTFHLVATRQLKRK